MENTRPEEVKWMLVPINYLEGLDEWVIKIENAIPIGEDEVDEIIKECKAFYGDRFNEIFIEEVLIQAHENYLDICLWELGESLKYD